MTQIKKNTEFQGPAIKPAGGMEAGKPEPAQRKDIVEMHNRLASMIAKLNGNIGKATMEKAEKDRAALVARLNEMETAVNKMEGTLRIELEPMLRNLVNEAVQRQQPPSGRRPLRTLVLATLFLAGIGAGIWAGISYPSQIRAASFALADKAGATWVQAKAILPLNGGSQNGTNQSQ